MGQISSIVNILKTNLWIIIFVYGLEVLEIIILQRLSGNDILGIILFHYLPFKIVCIS